MRGFWGGKRRDVLGRGGMCWEGERGGGGWWMVDGDVAGKKERVVGGGCEDGGLGLYSKYEMGSPEGGLWGGGNGGITRLSIFEKGESVVMFALYVFHIPYSNNITPPLPLLPLFPLNSFPAFFLPFSVRSSCFLINHPFLSHSLSPSLSPSHLSSSFAPPPLSPPFSRPQPIFSFSSTPTLNRKLTTHPSNLSQLRRNQRLQHSHPPHHASTKRLFLHARWSNNRYRI